MTQDATLDRVTPPAAQEPLPVVVIAGTRVRIGALAKILSDPALNIVGGARTGTEVDALLHATAPRGVRESESPSIGPSPQGGLVGAARRGSSRGCLTCLEAPSLLDFSLSERATACTDTTPHPSQKSYRVLEPRALRAPTLRRGYSENGRTPG